MRDIDQEIKKSEGHKLFTGNYEYFERNGMIRKASIEAEIMPDGYRTGRFECYPHQWETCKRVIKGLGGPNNLHYPLDRREMENHINILQKQIDEQQKTIETLKIAMKETAEILRDHIKLDLQKEFEKFDN